MSFLWPSMLLLLLLLPLVALAYLDIERRRRRRLAGLGMLRVTTAPRGMHTLQRYLPASLALAGLGVLVIALARPQAVVAVPREQGTVVLAFDVSGSMAAEDLAPNRLEAAKVAATAFVERQPLGVLIGVVAFSDSGLSVQAPTNDTDAVIAAIRRLDPQRGTSLARGIGASLATIATAEEEPNQGFYSDRSPAPSQEPVAVPPGSHASAVIVLLSDGENTVDPDPMEAAQVAADRGVAIHTIGIGSPGGVTLEIEGFSVHTALDEPMLQRIGEMTAGTYQRADTTEDLASIYDSIDARMVSRDEATELTAVAAGVGLALLMMGTVASFALAGAPAMTLLWPGLLVLLLLIPVLVALYLWAARRRGRPAVRYSSLSLIAAAGPASSNLRRHLPFLCFLAAVAALVGAMTRPVTVLSVPSGQSTILLVMDVSRSMCSSDIKPSRLVAAQAAATEFIRQQPATTQIGIVAFSGFAELVQAPTTDRQLLEDAIASFLTGRRTAVGSGIMAAIDAIAEVDQNVAPAVGRTSAAVPPAPVVPGAYAPAIIVVLTDGASNAGVEPADAAQQAADRGLRIFTIGFGTAAGEPVAPQCGPSFLGREPGGGGGGGGGFGGGSGFRRGIDEDTLRLVAQMTGGQYFPAESASELQTVLMGLPAATIMSSEVVELSVGFAGAGALLTLLALGFAQRWRPLP